MTDRILSEDGKYAPTVPVADSGPIVKPNQLPQKQGDPFAKVDHLRFDQASNMTVQEIMQIGVIAESRGDQNASLRWKSIGQERIALEQSQAAQAQARERMKPKTVPAHGAQIVTNQGANPWDQDPTYRKLLVETEQAVVAAQKVTATDAKLAANQAVAEAQDRLRQRQAEVRQEAITSGHWTEADDRMLDANQTIAQKAAQVQAQARTQA